MNMVNLAATAASALRTGAPLGARSAGDLCHLVT